MSFEEAWVLPLPLPSYDPAQVLARLRALLPAGIAVDLTGPDHLTFRVTFSTDDVDRLAAHLARRHGQLDWDWRDELDPPLADGETYDVYVELVHDGYPLVRISSKDGENRQAWPLVFSIASSLAEELDAVPEEDMPPTSAHYPSFIVPGRSTKPN